MKSELRGAFEKKSLTAVKNKKNASVLMFELHDNCRYEKILFTNIWENLVSSKVSVMSHLKLTTIW